MTPFRHPNLRAIARHTPGLPAALHRLNNRRILRRGYARLDYRGAAIDIHVSTPKIVRSRLRPLAKEP